MSTIQQSAGLERATAKRPAYSPLEVYWDAFLEWRRRKRLQQQLDLLSERELLDVGISREEIDYLVSSVLDGPDLRCPHSIGEEAR